MAYTHWHLAPRVLHQLQIESLVEASVLFSDRSSISAKLNSKTVNVAVPRAFVTVNWFAHSGACAYNSAACTDVAEYVCFQNKKNSVATETDASGSEKQVILFSWPYICVCVYVHMHVCMYMQYLLKLISSFPSPSL